jgi:GNAT superfamily N-acetyltransferase
VSQPYSRPRLLSPTDALDKFDSGEASLDDWLRKYALVGNASDSAKTFVTTTAQGQVAGFYALATASVQRSAVPLRVGKGQLLSVPVILLARLAVDQGEQGGGLGSHLLRDAIIRSVSAAEGIGVRALLVHALHERAKEFYLHFDFEVSPTDPLHLYLLMKDARALVGH